MQTEMSRQGRRVLRWVLRGACAGAALASACATGVDVTGDDFEQICSDPSLDCSGLPGVGGRRSTGNGGTGPVGSAGSSSNPVSGSGGAGGTGNSKSGGSSGTGSGVVGGKAGSSSGSSGTGGSTGPITGGSCTNIVEPTAKGGCVATSTASIVYTDRSNGAASTNQLTMKLRLDNTGAAIDLTKLVIRYWFTADGGASFTGDIDYATLNGQGDLKSSICVNFGDQLGSQFADIAFTGGGTAGTDGIQEVQLRVHTQNYSQLDQSNDFSYSASAQATANKNISVYVGGTLVGGCEPTG
jgi:cellulose 1,4-beta-cellobiosidase